VLFEIPVIPIISFVVSDRGLNCPILAGQGEKCTVVESPGVIGCVITTVS